MTPQEFVLFFVAVLLSASGQFFLKAGALKLGQMNPERLLHYVLGIVGTPELMAGLTCYGFGAMAYILLLTRVRLSVAAPAVALVYVFSVLMGYFLFQEPIPLRRVVGLGFIVCGVVLVIWKN